MARQTIRNQQRYLGVSTSQPLPDGQAAVAAAQERNSKAAHANGYWDMPEGTSAIHPNTGIRKAHSVGCTQSMEHSSGMWYDGRELNSGTLEHLDFEPVESPCGEAGALHMCYYDGQLYADSEAVYSDEDEDEEVPYGDDDDADETDDAAPNEDDEDSESPEELLYMHYNPDSKKGPAVVQHSIAYDHDFSADKVAFEKHKNMSSPVDPLDLHGRLMLVQEQYSS